MTYDEINLLAHADKPLPRDALLCERTLYDGLRYLYHLIRIDKNERDRAKFEAELLKGEFLRRKKELEKSVLAFTAYKMIQKSDDPVCKAICEQVMECETSYGT